jgi:hypothetical protein
MEADNKALALPDGLDLEIGRLAIESPDVAKSQGTGGFAVARPALMLAFMLGLNWGLVGIFGFDVVALVFGAMTPSARPVYVLLGISAIYCAIAVLMFSKRRAKDFG